MKGLSVLFTVLLFIAADQLASYLKRTARVPATTAARFGQLQARRHARRRAMQPTPPPLPTMPGVGPRLTNPRLDLSALHSHEVFE